MNNISNLPLISNINNSSQIPLPNYYGLNYIQNNNNILYGNISNNMNALHGNYSQCRMVSECVNQTSNAQVEAKHGLHGMIIKTRKQEDVGESVHYYVFSRYLYPLRHCVQCINALLHSITHI